MRGALIPKDDATCSFGLAFGFAHQQHLDPRGQAVDLLGLLGHGVGQVVGDPHQVCDPFFKGGDIHSPDMRMPIANGKRE